MTRILTPFLLSLTKQSGKAWSRRDTERSLMRDTRGNCWCGCPKEVNFVARKEISDKRVQQKKWYWEKQKKENRKCSLKGNKVRHIFYLQTWPKRSKQSAGNRFCWPLEESPEPLEVTHWSATRGCLWRMGNHVQGETLHPATTEDIMSTSICKNNTHFMEKL